MILPGQDGVDHINIYSRGKTALGRWMSNFDGSQSIETEDGLFESIEGYWYWLGSRDSKLRTLSGYRAKQYGRTCEQKVKLAPEIFRQKIQAALRAKLQQAPLRTQTEFYQSTLPFTHYYEDQKTGRKTDAGYEWIVEYWDYLREDGKMKQRGKIQLSRAQIHHGQKWQDGYLDTTVKSSTGRAKRFAPTWGMVCGHRDKTLSSEQYTKRYISEILASCRDDEIPKQLYKWATARNMQKLVFTCYCKDGQFCHTVLLVRWLCENYPEMFYR